MRPIPKAGGRALSMLYFTNSFGAAARRARERLPPHRPLGLPGTILTAGLLNVRSRSSVWAIARASPARRPRAQRALVAARGSARPARARADRRLRHRRGLVHLRDHLDPHAHAGTGRLDALLRGDARGLHPRDVAGRVVLRDRIDRHRDDTGWLAGRAGRQGRFRRLRRVGLRRRAGLHALDAGRRSAHRRGLHARHARPAWWPRWW